MSFLRRLLGRRSEPPAQAPSEAPPRAAPPDPLDDLARAGSPGGPSVEQAIAMVRRSRDDGREARALEQLGLASTRRRLPEPLLVVGAELAHARGDLALASGLLRDATSAAALILSADLLAERGDLARATSLVERVLARDIDAPGARERHARWRDRLGIARPAEAPARDVPTLVTASLGETPYRILREVARGGAGTVYEAEDDVLGRKVAYKVYHRREDRESQLHREARVAAKLAGPGVVRVLDASPDDGFIALEWARRGSLRDAVRARDVALLAPLVSWAVPLARALARVHAAGFAHCDLKPGNVLLRAPGDPILSDFGMARRRGEAQQGGTMGYVSPERLAGRAADAKDDVYAYGRIVEDALVAVGAAAADADAWRAVAARCLGPDDARPEHGAALVAILPLSDVRIT